MSDIQLSQKKINELKKQLKEVKATYDRQAEEHARGGGAAESWTETAAFRTTSMTLEKKAKDLEEIIKSTKILPDDIKSNKIRLGSWVEIKDEKLKIKKYRLVHPIEADPTQNLLSIESPLGAALMGKKEGDRVSVNGKEFDVVNLNG